MFDGLEQRRPGLQLVQASQDLTLNTGQRHVQLTDNILLWLASLLQVVPDLTLINHQPKERLAWWIKSKQQLGADAAHTTGTSSLIQTAQPVVWLSSRLIVLIRFGDQARDR